MWIQRRGIPLSDRADSTVSSSSITQLHVWNGSSLRHRLETDGDCFLSTFCLPWQPLPTPLPRGPLLRPVFIRKHLECCRADSGYGFSLIPAVCAWAPIASVPVLAGRHARFRRLDRLPILPVPWFPYLESRDGPEMYLRALCRRAHELIYVNPSQQQGSTHIDIYDYRNLCLGECNQLPDLELHAPAHFFSPLPFFAGLSSLSVPSPSTFFHRFQVFSCPVTPGLASRMWDVHSPVVATLGRGLCFV